MTTYIYQKKIMVGYRRPKNLRDLLVEANCTLPKKTMKTTESDNKARNQFLHGKKDTIKTTDIPKNNQRSGTIKCHVTGKNFCTQKNITCRSSNLVYLITCKTCGIPYVGQTKNTILERFQGHCGNITK